MTTGGRYGITTAAYWLECSNSQCRLESNLMKDPWNLCFELHEPPSLYMKNILKRQAVRGWEIYLIRCPIRPEQCFAISMLWQESEDDLATHYYIPVYRYIWTFPTKYTAWCKSITDLLPPYEYVTNLPSFARPFSILMTDCCSSFWGWRK